MSRYLLIALLAGLLGSPLALGAEPAAGAPPRQLGSDSFAFGGHVRIDQPITGDLIAAGGRLDVDAPVAGDAMLAAGRLRISAAVAQGVYAAGGQLTLDAPIGRHLRVAGGEVELGPQARVGGNVSAAGGQLTLRGPVDGAVNVAGGRVLIDGPVAGDVVSHAGRLSLGPNARLAGKLSYRGDAIDRDPAAQVAGAIERLPLPIVGGGAGSTPPPRGDADGDWSSDPRGAMHERGWRGWHGPAWPGAWTLGLMALAALLVWALPVSSLRVADAVRQRPGGSLLWGFVVLVCIPAAAVVLALTIVGIPLALVALLAYPALLLLGYLGGAVALGQWLLGLARPEAGAERGWRIAAAAIAVLLLALLGSLPVVGDFFALLAMLAGLGAMLLLLAPGSRPMAGAPRPASP